MTSYKRIEFKKHGRVCILWLTLVAACACYVTSYKRSIIFIFILNQQKMFIEKVENEICYVHYNKNDYYFYQNDYQFFIHIKHFLSICTKHDDSYKEWELSDMGFKVEAYLKREFHNMYKNLSFDIEVNVPGKPYNGRYVHPSLANQIVAWVAPKYVFDIFQICIGIPQLTKCEDSLKCSRKLEQLKNEQHGRIQNLIRICDRHVDTPDFMNLLKSKLSKMDAKLFDPGERYAHTQSEKLGTHAFAIVKLNANSEWSYMIVECKRKYLKFQILACKHQYPNANVIYLQKYVPNGVDVKALIMKDGQFKSHLNFLKELPFKESTLFNLMTKFCQASVDPQLLNELEKRSVY